MRICIALMPVLAWISGYSVAHAELKLAGIFSDHMVMQRERSVPVWGWADKGQFATVQFADQSVSAKVDDDGTWQAILKPLAASDESRKLVAACDGETIVVTDIVVGDIWHASGQSNMAMNVQAVAKHFSQAEADMGVAKLPNIRFRRIDEPQSAVAGKDIPIKAGWSVCSPETVGRFSAAAFYFARKLQGNWTFRSASSITATGCPHRRSVRIQNFSRLNRNCRENSRTASFVLNFTVWQLLNEVPVHRRPTKF